MLSKVMRKNLTLLVILRPSLIVFLERVVVFLAAGVSALQPLAAEVTMTVCGMVEEDFVRGPDDEDAITHIRQI